MNKITKKEKRIQLNHALKQELRRIHSKSKRRFLQGKSV